MLECGLPPSGERPVPGAHEQVFMSVSPRPRHPALAAALSFLFPGLGQAYTGQRQLAVILAAPVVLLALGAALVATLFVGQLRNDLLSAPFLTAALVADFALLGWRLFAIAHVGLVRPRRLATISLVGLLLVTTVGMHAWAGIVLGRLNTALDDVFSGTGRGAGIGERPNGGPLNRPEYRWDGTERINFLLLGVDAGPGRPEALTDTILAVSVDPVAKTAVMVSVPRDTGFLPLPNRTVYADGVYPKKINELATEASSNPELWCADLPAAAATACGLRTLERSVGLYLGITIQFYAQVDLEGFAEMIDAVGGVTLCLPGKMVDPDYTGPTSDRLGIELPGGCRHYDGADALAYARIRRGWIELPDGTRERQDDFKRSERQQEVLLQLRREFAAADLLFELPDLLQAVGATVSTDFPRSKAGDLASLLPLITGHDIKRLVLAYPEFVDPPLEPDVNYLLLPRRDDVRAGMQELFGADTVLEGWYLGTDADGPPPADA
jgi:LCP family protein required for cell wall assembly